MAKDKNLETQVSEVKTAEDIANEILMQNGIDKAEIVELSKNLFVIKSQIEQETASLETIRSEYKNLATEVKKTQDEAKAEAKKIVQDARQEAQSIISQARDEAKDKAAQTKSLQEDSLKAIREQQELLSKREADIVKKEKDLIKREFDIQERENNAQLGFAKQFDDEKEKSRREIDKLKQEIESLQKKRIEVKSQIDDEMDKYKAAKLKELEDLLANKRKSLDEAIESNNKKALLLEQKEAQLADMESEVKFEKEALAEKKDALKQYESSIDSKVESLVQERYQSLLVEIQTKKESLNKLMSEYQNVAKERDNFAIRIGQSRAVDVDNLRLQIDQLKSELDTAIKAKENLQRQMLDDGMSKSTIESFKAKAAAYDALQEKYNSVCRQLEQIKIELAKKNNDSEMLALQIGYNAQLKATADELTKELERKKVVARVERLDSITRELPALKAIDELPLFKDENQELLNETRWLDYIQKQAELSGIVFSKRLLNAYHTSLKIGEWSPLVVLAGVSGTGKSELPRQYALHGGMNFLSVPVKPDWDSPQSLFGYYNSIENKFEPTELLRALYQMQPTKNSKKGDQMLMVLLDEMNLAHVELYFSDLLSKFETRRGSNSPVEYEISLGAGADSELLQIGTNVLWTGTMNEDETTKALSDKVVDRSTLITFPRPKKLIGRNKNVNQKTKYVLDKEQWSKWLNSAVNIEQIDKTVMDDMQDTVERINAKMSELGRNLGHRVWQGIQNYIVNYPDVISSSDESKRREAIQKAFSEAVAFKIMPKLRGVEVSGEYEDIIDDIAKIIQDKIPELVNDFTKAKSLPSKLFMWHSAEFLEN